MTYIACSINKNGIVIGSDTRANYFDDYIEKGEIKGKQIKFYWDGNKKLFLLKNKIAVAIQGLLFWGDQKILLSKHIDNIEKILSDEKIEIVARKIHKYFKETKRKNSEQYEVEHFLVCGIENSTPKGFYVNIYYNEDRGIQELPFNEDKTLYVNGDGKAEYIDKVASIEKNISFCKEEVLKKHLEIPYDVGDKVDILTIPSNKPPYWAEQTEEIISYNSYDDLMQAIKCQKLKVEMLNNPQVLFYKQ